MSGFVLDVCDGIQHVGIPTADMEKSAAFYQNLGFTVAHENTFDGGTKRVIFLQRGSVTIEVYENPAPATDGAINHIAIDCGDVERAYQTALAQGLTILSDGIEALPYWERGVRYFIIQGPDKERIEFSQRL